MTSSATVSSNSNDQATPESTASTTRSSGNCLKLKGSLLPMTVLELAYYDEAQIQQELSAKTTQAPGFFENLPVIIDIEQLTEEDSVPFDKLINQCREFSIKAVAVRGGLEKHQQAAKEAGLGLLAKQKERQAEPAPEKPEAKVKEVVHTEVETVEVVKTVVQQAPQQSKIIHTPIRSGQQVYAADGDLIILAPVSAGAEILADGNIHVYGALRGRALAGVKGNTNARIFCHSLEAELVSVAGQYKISEDIDKAALKKPTQVYLSNETLSFKELEI
ncbi:MULTISPECIES: septum site-determining protein MinC [unclassified Oleiphilus]|jgi:septum site-determining protein MinC|nr:MULTISPECIES: septum site-determining protein MinC [unclassified Oleiphilus]